MATKKTVTKTSSRKRSTKKAATPDPVYWVLSERTALFTWTPMALFKTKAEADARRIAMEEQSPYSLRGYKVDRVVLQD